MRRWAVAAVAVTALAAAACASAAPERGLVSSPGDIARTRDDGVFTVDCAFSHRAFDDPIVHPGAPGASHSHDFFGNVSTDAFSTARSLLGEGTTCEDKQDTASYWAPTLFDGGETIDSSGARAYYGSVVGADVTAVQAPPAGIELLAGDAHATEMQPTSVVGWGCGFRPKRVVAAPPSTCSVALPLTLELFFPDCWDGRHLDSVDHRSHAAYSRGGRCPGSHPVPIAKLELSVQYPIWGDTSRVALGSGSIVTAHGDFFNTWVQSRLESQVRLCIHAKANCTIG